MPNNAIAEEGIVYIYGHKNFKVEENLIHRLFISLAKHEIFSIRAFKETQVLCVLFEYIV